MLTVSELASRLKVTRKRAYDLVRYGMVPCVRIGRQVRIDERVLERWIQSGGSRRQTSAGGNGSAA